MANDPAVLEHMLQHLADASPDEAWELRDDIIDIAADVIELL